jgi:hypothetical protein
MTTTHKGEVVEEALRADPVPEVLTDEHHEAIKQSWELPAYERPAEPAMKSHKVLYAGLVAGALGLAVGAATGYWVGSDSSAPVAPAPIVITVPIDPDSVHPATDFGARRVESAAPDLNSVTDFGARRVESAAPDLNSATDFGARRVEM